MTKLNYVWVAACAALAGGSMVGCGGGGGGPCGSADIETTNCVFIEGGDSAALLEAANSLSDDTTLLLGEGTFALSTQLTLRNADGLRLVGAGMDATTLDFGEAVQGNGVDVIGDDFVVQDLTVLDAPKDGIRVEDSDGVTFRRIRATWTNELDETNGAYGIYPVRVRNVLVEDSEAFNSSDAGIYVGQCVNAVVRNNTARGNVAGIEIENTQFADVYGNLAYENVAGLVVFDLPGNPVVGRDVHLHDNTVRDNNITNFAPSGFLTVLPPGVGTFVMASRRVLIENNTYEANISWDIAIASGLIESDPATWNLVEADLVGDYEGIDLEEGTIADNVANYRTEDVLIQGNTHEFSGTSPSPSVDFGLLVATLWGSTGGTPDVIYDMIGESAFSADDATGNSNDNNVCLGTAMDTSLGVFHDTLVAVTADDPASAIASMETYVYDAGVSAEAFGCTAFSGDPIIAPTLPQLAGE